MIVAPSPEQTYNQVNEAQFRRAVTEALNSILSGNFTLQKGASLVIFSPDGHRWSVALNNAGQVVSTLLA